MSTTSTLHERLKQYGQQHLLRFWDQLNNAQRQRLARQLDAIDFEALERLRTGEQAEEDWDALAARAVGPQAFRLGDAGNRFTAEQARAAGERALAAGKIGAVLVAGGQGTRLGFDHPKGMYAIGPVSGASLFQIHTEKLAAMSRRAGRRIPLYLMTSPATHDETVAFLAAHHRFGLPREDVHVFCQGTMPAVDMETGRVLLAAPDELFLSPDGHGGMLAALVRTGALADIRRRGIEHLFYFQVDNPLIRVCDPEFIGYHLLAGSELTTGVVAKTAPEERVGHIVSVDGQTRIIEYSDLPDEHKRRRDASGGLALWAGNVAVHVLAVALLERAAADESLLPFHVARKAVPYMDEQGQNVSPSQPNALKFERFIFDLLPAASVAVAVELDRATSFAPVKNAPGEKTDTPEAACAQMSALHRSWVAAAGGSVAADAVVEISPLFALDADDVRRRVKPGEIFAGHVYLHDT